MNRVLHCFQALGMIKCIPLTWSKGQRSVREGWNWAKRQAWSHQLWFQKKGKRSLHVSVSFGHSLLVRTWASSSVCVAHSRKLKIRRRRRQKRQERCRKGVGCKCSTLFCLLLWRHWKLRRDNWTCQDMGLRNSSQRRSPTFDKVRELEYIGYEDWMKSNSLYNRRCRILHDKITGWSLIYWC